MKGKDRIRNFKRVLAFMICAVLVLNSAAFDVRTVFAGEVSETTETSAVAVEEKDSPEEKNDDSEEEEQKENAEEDTSSEAQEEEEQVTEPAEEQENTDSEENEAADEQQETPEEESDDRGGNSGENMTEAAKEESSGTTENEEEEQPQESSETETEETPETEETEETEETIEETEEEPAAFAQTGVFDGVKITVTAEPGVLPADATLEAEEIKPVDQESADAYAEAITSLSEKLQEKEKTYSGAKVYDIRILDADGQEIEPNGEVQVKMEYLKPEVKVEKKADAEVAHVDDDGNVEMMDAEVKTTILGKVKSAEFTTEGFSYYIVFGTQAGSTSEPINIGTYGWLKFATPGTMSTDGTNGDWGHYRTAAQLPAINSEEGYHRILQVKLHTLNAGGYGGSLLPN